MLQCTGRFSEMMSPLRGGRGGFGGGRGFRGSPHQQHFSPNFHGGGRGNSPNFRGGFRGRGGGPPPSPFMMQGHPGFRGHSPNFRGGRGGGGHRGRGGGGSDQVIPIQQNTELLVVSVAMFRHVFPCELRGPACLGSRQVQVIFQNII